MVTPVAPSEFKSCIPVAGDDLAEAIRKVFIKLPVLIWRYQKWKRNEFGALSYEYKTAVCEARANCPPSS